MQAFRVLTRLRPAASQLTTAVRLSEAVTAAPVRTFWGRCSPRWVRVPVRKAEVATLDLPALHDNFWRPVGPLGRALLEDIQADMRLLRSEFWADVQAASHSKERALRLPAEVAETKSHYKVTTDVPGIERENVKVKVSSEGILEITATRTEAVEAEEVANKQLREYKFKRAFNLPEEVDREGIKANLKNGRLEVVLPKVPSPTPVEKEVEIAMG